MNINKCIIRRIGISLIFLISLTGCATLQKADMVQTMTNFNAVVEKAQNEMLLLNIIRASERRPMYFTGFNQIRGSLSYSVGTGSFTVPFGPGATSLVPYSINPTATYTTNPTFDVTVWNDKDFIKGMMEPVAPEVMDYYIRTLGWPKDMLLPLFINSIEIIQPGKDPVTLKNDPDINQKNEFDKFKSKLSFIAENCEIASVPKTETIGPEIDASDVDLDDLIEMKNADLDLEKVKYKQSKYQLTATKKDYYLKCKDGADYNQLKKATTDPEIMPGKKGLKISFAKDFKLAEKKDYSEEDKKEDKDKTAINIYLRSPEGILYFLGEILRRKGVEDNFHYKFIMKVQNLEDKDFLLFEAHKATNNDRGAAVAVDYEGTKYVIPYDPPSGHDRSMHVLSFISLLIYQQKSTSSVQPTGTVSVIGGK